MDDHGSGLPLGMPAPRETNESRHTGNRPDRAKPDRNIKPAEPVPSAEPTLRVLSVTQLRQSYLDKGQSGPPWPETLMGLCAAGLAAAGLYRLDGWRLAELLVLLGIGALLLINPVVPINWSSRHRPAARQTPDHHS